jgi:hypothetical protein
MTGGLNTRRSVWTSHVTLTAVLASLVSILVICLRNVTAALCFCPVQLSNGHGQIQNHPVPNNEKQSGKAKLGNENENTAHEQRKEQEEQKENEEGGGGGLAATYQAPCVPRNIQHQMWH